MIERYVNLEIQFNKNIIQILKSHNLSVELLGSALFILFALSEERYDLLDLFDDNNKERRAIILYKQLELRGLLVETNSEEKSNFILTPKGKHLVTSLKTQFYKEDHIEVNTEVLEKVVKIEKIAEWIGEYNGLFPTKFRDHSKIVSDRLESFMEEYPQYSKETIIKATKMYIKSQEQSESGHQFTRRSLYFIYKGAGKDRISDLATWCEKALETKEDTLDTSIFDTV